MKSLRSSADNLRNPVKLWHIAFFWGLLASGAPWAADVAIRNTSCGTELVYETRLNEREGANASAGTSCPLKGECDDPMVRNGYLSDGRVIVLRLYFQVVCLDDGSDPAARASDVAAQVSSLNTDFAPYGFRFDYDLRFINSTRYRFLADFTDAEAMKSDYAVNPARQLNIFVTTNAFCLCSYATYPWDPSALTSQGGIVMTRERFFPQSSSGASLTHEIGHCLGLWHTQRGVIEVPQCSDCYEAVGATNRDLTGDFCEDTDPTPSNFTCLPPDGVDLCSDRPWGAANPQNYMGYGPDNCLSEFSPEQVARMHCWTESRLGSIAGLAQPSDTLFGAAPFTITLAGRVGRSITQWRWDFGDGQTSGDQNPVHTYTRAGVFDIRCTVVTDSGAYRMDSLPQVYVTGDTLVVGSGAADTSMSARVDISIDNRVPLSQVVIPLNWDGPFGLTFDSVSTAGLRTSHLTAANGGITVGNLQQSNRRMTVVLNADSTNLMSPGSGRILGLYFHTPKTLFPGENPIRIVGYDANEPILRTIPGAYTPYSVNGALRLGCCTGSTGNVDGDPENIVDVVDLSALISYMFIDMNPIPCASEANVDGDSEGRVDISDLTRLMDFLYISFTPPAACP